MTQSGHPSCAAHLRFWGESGHRPRASGKLRKPGTRRL